MCLSNGFNPVEVPIPPNVPHEWCCDNARAEIAFGINALFGRSIGANQSQGPWDPTNAMDFIQYTHDMGYKISAWEFGIA